MSLSISRRTAAASRAESDILPFHKTLRLMLPKLGVSYLFVMLLSVFNRVMINELKIGATIVGLLYLAYNVMNIFQVTNGRWADRRTLFGLRRTPMMVLGLTLSALALVPFPYAAFSYAAGNTAALFEMLLCMAVFGFGFAMNGDSHNTLIAEVTEGKRNRPGVVSAVWLFQLVCIVASGIVISIMLASAEIAAGAPRGCTTTACLQIKHEVAVGMMPKLFLAGPIVCLVGFLGLIGIESRLTREQAKAAQQRPPLNIRQAYTRIFANPQSRVFFFVIVSSIFGLFLQDDILEPFGADVFKLSAAQTAQFQPIMGSATILAMLIMGIVASRWPIPKRRIADWGAIMSGAGFALLVASALLGNLQTMYAGITVLGAGMGVFNIGALSMMMDMTVPGETGSLMGAWGMAQALANGMGQLAGGFMRDTGLHLTGNAPLSYSGIFCVSILMCFIAINLMAKVDVQKFRRLTRDQLGLAMDAA